MKLRTAVVGTFLILLPPLAAVAQAPPAGPGAAAAVRASIEVEQALLEDDTRRYARLRAERNNAMAGLEDLYRRLDAMLAGGESAAAIQVLMDQIESAEAARAKMLAAERVVIERIAERRRKISLLDEQVAALEDSTRRAGGAVSGSWDVSLMPINQRGKFALNQSGTLLSGTYTLEGGFSGSLQGTLVNRKVYLVRIDSKLGRSMEFEGYLAGDGNRIRGTWLNYELAGQEGSTGQWSATRGR